MSVLKKILEQAEAVIAKGERPVVVFDLDHTLFDNGPRTWTILREFAEATKHQELHDALGRIAPTGLDYLLTKTLAKVGFDDAGLHDEAIEFWKERFFTDDYQSHDIPMPGAVDFVGKLWDMGGLVVYLTGRDAPGMLVGCIESLRRHGFPCGVVRTVPLLKPDFETTDLVFKSEAVRYISTLGEVVGAFDNEPSMCNLFHETWPEAHSVLLDTEHAPDPPDLAAAVIRVDDFQL
jgi:hypothetical protein